MRLLKQGLLINPWWSSWIVYLIWNEQRITLCLGLYIRLKGCLISLPGKSHCNFSYMCVLPFFIDFPCIVGIPSWDNKIVFLTVHIFAIYFVRLPYLRQKRAIEKFMYLPSDCHRKMHSKCVLAWLLGGRPLIESNLYWWGYGSTKG